MSPRCLIAASLLAGLSLAAPLRAGGDHDHGHDRDHGHVAAPAATGPAPPRFSASSADFELVGVLDGRELTLYLDRYADNLPVLDAEIELDFGGTVVKALAHDDHYEAMLPTEPAPGAVPLVATISTADAVDLLDGQLEVPASEDHTGASDRHRLAGWVVAGLLALGWIGSRAFARGGRA
jgi:hypothetical protein